MSQGRCVASLHQTVDRDGYFQTVSSAGETLSSVSTLAANRSHGFMGVYDASSPGNAAVAGLTGDGRVFGTTKNFVVPHPKDEEKLIVYTSLEGPTADMYVRGQLSVDGIEAFIELPEHFAAMLSSPSTLNVQLTARGPGCGPMYVGLVTEDGFVLHRERAGPCRLDYLATGLRAGFEETPVVMDRRCSPFSPASPHGSDCAQAADQR